MSDELLIIEREDARKAFTDKTEYDALRQKILALASEYEPDMATAKGRKELNSFCFKIGKVATRIDSVRTELTEDMRRQIAEINAAGKEMVEDIRAIRDEKRKPLTEWEEAEKLRVETIRKTIEDARALGQVRFGESSAQIQERMNKLPTHDLDWYAEFKDEAQLVLEAAFNGLSIAKTAALNAEKEAADRAAEQAELQRLRQAEQERLAKERAEEEARKEEEARRLQAQIEADRKVAAERAAMERQQAELQRQLDEANRKAAEAEKAAQEAQERAERAAEDERRRQAEERATAERQAEERALRGFPSPAAGMTHLTENIIGVAASAEREVSAETTAEMWAEFCKTEAIKDLEAALFPNRELAHPLLQKIMNGKIRHIRFEA